MVERTLDIEILNLIINSTLPLTDSVARASHIAWTLQLFSGGELDIAIHAPQGCYKHQIEEHVKAVNAEVTQQTLHEPRK